MKKLILGLTSVALIAGAALANASEVSFDFTASGLTAIGTLDVVGGQAISGTGTITGAILGGAESLTLVTASTTGVNPDAGGGNLSYRFGGGTDLIGNTNYSSTAPYVDPFGLVFLVGGPSHVGFNVWSNSATDYTGFLAGDSGLYNGFDGTLTSAPVPLPAALPLLISGLAGLGAMRRRRKLAQA